MSKRKKSSKKYLRAILASALVSTSFFNMALPLLAEGTAAGVQINNKATATYEDPDGNEITTESNEVVITVAEVGGLTNVAQTPNDVNGGSVISGDTILYPFVITNTGNETTDVFVPHIGDITTTNLTPTRVFIDLDGDGLYTAGTDALIIDDGAGGSTIFLDADDSGTVTGGDTTISTDGLYPNVNAGESFTVIVEGTINGKRDRQN